MGTIKNGKYEEYISVQNEHKFRLQNMVSNLGCSCSKFDDAEWKKNNNFDVTGATVVGPDRLAVVEALYQFFEEKYYEAYVDTDY